MKSSGVSQFYFNKLKCKISYTIYASISINRVIPFIKNSKLGHNLLQQSRFIILFAYSPSEQYSIISPFQKFLISVVNLSVSKLALIHNWFKNRKSKNKSSKFWATRVSTERIDWSIEHFIRESNTNVVTMFNDCTIFNFYKKKINENFDFQAFIYLGKRYQ